MTMETRTRLPEFLRPLFWDVAFHTLSPEQHQSFICLRLIEHGDLDALRWMVGYYGKPRLREWLIARRGRGVSPRALYFWAAVLDIPQRTVKRWLRERTEPLWPPSSTSK
jgi:hypothetical protein